MRIHPRTALGGTLAILGGVLTAGSTPLPWWGLGTGTFGGIQIPSLSFNGISTWEGKIALVLGAALVLTGVLILALRRKASVVPFGIAAVSAGATILMIGLVALLRGGVGFARVGLYLAMAGGLAGAAAGILILRRAPYTAEPWRRPPPRPPRA